MINELLVNLVNNALGQGKRTARGNQAYICPFCNHHKPKLEVNFTENSEVKILGHVGLVEKKAKQLEVYLTSPNNHSNLYLN